MPKKHRVKVTKKAKKKTSNKFDKFGSMLVKVDAKNAPQKHGLLKSIRVAASPCY